MIAYNFQRNAHRRFIQKEKNKLKAIQCTDIQDGRHTNMKNLCLLMTFF